MERYWVKQYPPGVPADVDWRRFDTVATMMEDAFVRHANRSAYVFMDREIRFDEVDRLSRAFGAWLQARGLEPGARVAIMLPNVPQYPVALAAALRAGCVVTNVNPLYTPRELEHQLKDSGAEAIIVLENFAATLQQVIGKTSVRHVVVASIGDMLGFPKGALVNLTVRRVRKLVPVFVLPGAVQFNDAVAQGRGLPLKPVQRRPDDVAFLQYTGGTTGVSKAAMLLNRNIVANVLQMEALIGDEQEARRRATGEEQISMACPLPLYHAAALVCCCLVGLRLGLLLVLIPNPRDIRAFVRELRKHPVNWMTGVNTLFNALADDPGFRKLDFSRMYWSSGGATAVQQAVADKWRAVTGNEILQAYGLTEASPVVTSTPPNAGTFSGDVGLPVPGTEVEIWDEEGRALPPGQPGELVVRGPQVMAGYWQRPDETARVLTPEGYLRTGDMAVMDERGFVKIVDRKKDMIIVSGFNVYPNEVEDVVAMHPGVRECAAIGVPDAHSGEAVKLFVVRADPGLTAEAVMDHCRAQLTGYKRPKSIEFRDDLPKTPVGKILRRELRA
jgi:long-chain acyl-CoA synthetase